MRRVPSPFGWAINALNAEQEFSPRDIAFTQPITSPGGPLRPYWVELRNSAYMVGQTIALSRLERPSPAIAIQELPYALPPESTYRRAQAEFVSTFRDLVEKWREEDWDSAKCFKKYPHVGKRIQTLLRRRPLVFLPTSGGPALLINPFSPSAPFGVQRIPKRRTDLSRAPDMTHSHCLSESHSIRPTIGLGSVFDAADTFGVDRARSVAPGPDVAEVISPRLKQQSSA